MLELIDMTAITTIWGNGSVGRVSAWHGGGQRFESAWLNPLVFASHNIYLFYLC